MHRIYMSHVTNCTFSFNRKTKMMAKRPPKMVNQVVHAPQDQSVLLLFIISQSG